MRSQTAHSKHLMISSTGIVRITERGLADQKRSRHSRGELTPFSERGSAALLEGIAAVEVAVLVEVVVDRGMGGGEFLQGPHIFEFRHRSFSPSERLVGILGSIAWSSVFQPSTRRMVICPEAIKAQNSMRR